MNIKYRPEIDGLRAIAVGLVIIYHAEINLLNSILFKGGFIGVDIFFVISGYLITSIILKELNTTNSFSFKYFYERRIRRIVPVLLFVSIFSIPISWICLSPIEFINFSKSVLYSLGFTSNLFFYFSGQEYAALSGLYKPFLHTWSLSVEEQYYLFFPLFFFIIFKFFKKNLLAIFSILFLISLYFAEYGSRNFSSLNFYILPTRIWELILGSILAYSESKNKIQNTNVLGSILPFLGICLIIYSSIFFDHNLRHPSIYTLLPVAGTAMIIGFTNKNNIIKKILSSKIFVGTGLISYSLYLWHFPIFAFARITEITSGDVLKKMLLGLIIFLLSIFSYFFLERPFRDKNYDFKKIILFLIFLILIIILFYSSIIYKKGFPERMPKILQNVSSLETHKLIKNSENKECLGYKDGCFFNQESNKKVYIIGDSHAATISSELKEKLIKKNYNFSTYLIGDCGFFPGFNLIEIKTNKIDRNCNEFYFKKIENELLKNNDAIIIYSSRLPLYLENKEFDSKDANGGKSWNKIYQSKNKTDKIKTSFNKFITKLSKSNKVILVYPIPEFDIHIPKRLLNMHLKRKLDFENLNTNHFITTSYEVYRNRSKSSFELLNSIKNKNIHRIYPHTIFCNNLIKDKCISHDKNTIYYFDSNHLSLDGSRVLSQKIMNEINKIESK